MTTLAMHESGGWLAAVAPVGATRFRVSDPDIVHSLREAGAQLVDRDADVEIGSLDQISGNAPLAIVGLNLDLEDSPGRIRQVTGRLTRTAQVRVRAARVHAALQRRGYSNIRVLRWDRDQIIRLPGLVEPGRGRMAERFQRRVLLVAGRDRPGRSALEQALVDARRLTGRELEIIRPVVGSGNLIVMLNDGVLRLAVGPASRQIDSQAEVLRALHAGSPSDTISARVPKLLALGTAGLARWSLERRLPGMRPPPTLDQSLLNQCLDFLVALFGVRGDGQEAPHHAVTKQAQILSSFVPEEATAIEELAGRVSDQIADLPSGFGHGDFCTTNLLVQNEQLLAVVDWEQAGPRRPPLLDLFHLRLAAMSRSLVHQWGPAIVGHLLPLVRRGEDVVMKDYLRRVDLELSTRQLEHLVAAYWLDQVSLQMGTFFDRRRDPLWIERNVTEVLAPLLHALTGRTRVGSAI